MNISLIGNDLILEQVKDFDIEQTLECGQCFHFEKITDKEYVVIAYEKLLHIKQIDNKIMFFNTTIEEYECIWKYYFDLERDYAYIKETLLKKDTRLIEAIEAKNGVRILNQEFFETLISFIISQNKQIPHIKKIVETISERFGKPVGEVMGKTYYSFPDVSALCEVSEEELRECKTGFRAPYIADACNRLHRGEIVYNDLNKSSTEEVLLRLQKIKGVGEKIANCVLLFGLSRREAFPIDVWIQRIMEFMYFGDKIGRVTKEEIKCFAQDMYGEFGGYAQQYLFYYGRENKIGIDKENKRKTKEK